MRLTPGTLVFAKVLAAVDSNGDGIIAIGAFSIGIEAGHQMIVLPLFALLKKTRGSHCNAVAQTNLSIRIKRIGSAGISIAGVYYLCLTLLGNS